jgi:PAS domain S-box-containing protein
MTTAAPLRSLKWPIILNYAIAVVSAAISVAVAFAVYPSWGADPALLLFLSVIMFVALAAGPGPAALTSALTFVSLQYPLLSPGYPFVLQSGEILRLGLFIVASALAVMLSAARQRASASLQLLRDNQRMMQQQNDRLRAENAEHSEAVTRAREAEEEIRLIVDTVPALLARYRPDGFMDFRNKQWRQYTGLSEDNQGGRRWGSALHPDDEEMVERKWREHIATGEAFELEQRLRKADGQYRWHRVRRVPLHGETGEVIKWYAIAFDVDDRKQTDDALRKSEADLAKARHELQLIIDTIPVLVLRHRADGIIDFVNEVGRIYSGLTATKWTSRVSKITHPDDVPQLEAAWDVALRTGESFESELRLRRADGEYRWFMTRRVPLRRDGEVIAWYAATYDIEDRKRAESELIESERRFRQAQMELAHASRVVTMGQFTASIAHEVNQPLAAALTNAETALRWLARQAPDLEQTGQSIERIISDAKRAVAIVSRIRDFSKKAPVRKEAFEVNEAILEIVRLTRSAMSDNGILVKMQLSEGLRPILGDRVQLQQVILNLIMNAIEAMGEGSQGSRELLISSSVAESSSVLVAVSDSGPGLPGASPERIFDAFYTTKASGLGIGLSICRSIVEAHGGRLWATPNEPQGAVFRMMLPIEERSLEKLETSGVKSC